MPVQVRADRRTALRRLPWCGPVVNPENRKKFLEHALDQMPREACALLIETKHRQELVICENQSEVPNQFVIGPTDYLKALQRGLPVGVVHSHCYEAPTPSEADLVQCERSHLPWYILSVPTGQWHSFGPTNYKAPLVGRSFSHGVLDCYSLIRDYYLETLGIELKDFDRDYEWWDKGQNLYLENFQSAGFREVPPEDMLPHDVLLMQIHSDVVNHGAIYLGDDLMLHHLNRRLSTRDVYGGYYQRHTVKVLRHEDC
ncbi:MAG: peptidase P60 [Lysobacteraceae bacterium]|nr:MAG: peptidase P60 [Xanthomonadaceae bacterium]